jgi:hypothetical protein
MNDKGSILLGNVSCFDSASSEESSSISPTAGTFVPTLYISVTDIKDLKLVHEDQKDQATNSISISSLSRPNQLLSDPSPTLVAADSGKLKSYL